MTTYNSTTLKTFFQTNDVPTGTDYANFIDSYVNVVNTGDQSIASKLTAVKYAAPLVSAAVVNVTTCSASNLLTSYFSAGSAVFTGTVSAKSSLFVTDRVTASAAAFTADVSANGTVYASAFRAGTGALYRAVAIVSAAGTAQATGASLGTNGIVRLKGISDGQATGFRLLANQTGLQQTIWVEENTSCNLWPPTGGQINALSSNAAFGMAGNTQYIVTHIKASGYCVK